MAFRHFPAWFGVRRCSWFSPISGDPYLALMSRDALSLLKHALGMQRPLRLAVMGPEQGEPQYFEVDAPFAVVGRARNCDIPLPDRSVSFRHAYLQVFGDRVTCVDLLSPGGIRWDGPGTEDWLAPEHRLGVGPYWVQLFDDGWSRDFSNWPAPLACRCREPEAAVFGELPQVDLRLANRKLRGMSWPINRVLTLVGRDDRCRITCGDERVSRVHCSLLLTRYGLWVIDLLGRDGIQVNGDDCRTALLMPGDELAVGQYRMQAVYAREPPELTLPPVPSKPGPPDTAEIAIPPQIINENLPSPGFLTRNHKIFPIELVGNTVVVRARGGIRTAPYQEIQLEANAVTSIISTRGFSNVVVDLQHADAMDSIVINAIMSFCRGALGKAALCCASDSMREVIAQMTLTRLWPLYATREEALQAVNS